jgi:hypothetical protein
MKESGRSLTTLSGAGFCLLGLAGTLAYPAEPSFVDAPAKLATFYGEEHETLLVANSLYLLGAALLIVFAGVLYSFLRQSEDGDGRLATMALGGTLAGATLALGGAALDTGAALRVEEQGSIAPDTAAAMADASDILFGLAAPMAFGVAVLATAAVAFRSGALPIWLAALSVPLGIALLVPPINYVSVIAFTFWCMVTSIVLFLRPRTEEVPGRVTGSAPAAAGV